jgi:hypothetical protein
MKLQANMKLFVGLLGIVGIQEVSWLNSLYVTEKIILQGVIGIITICILVHRYKKDK